MLAREGSLLGEQPTMSLSKYHGHTMEISILGCTNLKNLEWFTKQDPYIVIEYGTMKLRTKTCKDGGRNPAYQDKFSINLVEGIEEMNLLVWNSNTFTAHQLIGSGKVQLNMLISRGFDNRSWMIYDDRNRSAGEVKLHLYCSSLNEAKENPTHHVLPPPSPLIDQMPPGRSTYPFCSCHACQSQNRSMYPCVSQVAQPEFCQHHQPNRQYSHPSPYHPEYHTAGPSHYPPDHRFGFNLPHY